MIKISRSQSGGGRNLNKAASEQPTPKGSGVEIVGLVIKDLEARSEVGLQRYGEKLKAFNGRDSLLDAYQEALDLCMYLRQALAERQSPLEEDTSL